MTAVAGTVFIAAGAFWLSFTSLADLAARSGIGDGQAWAWPLIVDGVIVVSTVAVVALADARAAWYPWTLLAGAASVSVTANSLHAVVAADSDVPGFLAAAVAAVPPVVLLAITHLTVLLIRAPETVGPSESVTSVSPQERAAAFRAEGWSNKRIARELDVHPSTVGRWFASAPIEQERMDAASATSEEGPP
ncbi:helix-turn-helix domain-containing protein [Microbacterium oxydans]|nr:helix-turn-helix domain-containing protein [Microbacterium oxydans]